MPDTIATDVTPRSATITIRTANETKRITAPARRRRRAATVPLSRTGAATTRDAGLRMARSTASTAAKGSEATATATVAAPIALCALALWAIFMVLMSLLVGGAADEDRIAGARHVADVATRAYVTGANRGDYHWKGQLFRDYVGGTTGVWDAAFCSWCLGQAGFVDSGLVGRYASIDSFVARFEFNHDAGDVHAPDDQDYAPEAGDLLVLWEGTDAAHIGVVTEVSADGQTVTCVEGDVAGGEVGSYDRDADGLGGYVAMTERQAHASGTTYLHPNYSADAASAHAPDHGQGRT